VCSYSIILLVVLRIVLLLLFPFQVLLKSCHCRYIKFHRIEQNWYDFCEMCLNVMMGKPWTKRLGDRTDFNPIVITVKELATHYYDKTSISISLYPDLYIILLLAGILFSRESSQDKPQCYTIFTKIIRVKFENPAYKDRSQYHEYRTNLHIATPYLSSHPTIPSAKLTLVTCFFSLLRANNNILYLCSLRDITLSHEIMMTSRNGNQ
jgi:hypothetical protein